MEQSLTIADLISLDASGCTLIAGAGGLDRQVQWAHSCELPEPYRWLGTHELLMTVGHCIPEQPEEQVQLLKRLERAGIAGVILEDNDFAPKLSEQMLAEADRLALPIMSMARTVPFASIARMVAAANTGTQAQQLLTLSHLYQAALGTHTQSDGFMRQLEEVFAVRMAAVDVATGVVILPGSLQLDAEEIRSAGREVLAHGTGRIARIGSLRDGSLSTWQLPTDRPTILLVQEGSSSMLDSFTLAHLSQVVAGESNQRAASALASGQRRAQVLLDAVDGSIALDRRVREAQSLGMPTGSLRVAVTRPEHEATLFPALCLAGLPHSSVLRSGYFTLVLPTDRLPELEAISSYHGLRLGLSPEVADLGGVRNGMLQAQWAYESLDPTQAGFARYEDATFSVSPRSESQAKEIVEQVFGPLLSSGNSGPTLVQTLCAYLDADRSWSATSEALGIHRQTLAYRLGRIEQLTGRNLKASRDIAELWIARVSLKHQ